MHVATVNILFWWFLFILDEFWYETSYIGKINFLPFYAYIECQKQSTDAILTSVLEWIWPCHISHGHDDVSNARDYCENNSNGNADVSNDRCCYFWWYWCQWCSWLLSLWRRAKMCPWLQWSTLSLLLCCFVVMEWNYHCEWFCFMTDSLLII
jgi:hypothetical protein